MHPTVDTTHFDNHNEDNRSMRGYSLAGKHLIVEMHEVCPQTILDLEILRTILGHALELCGATICGYTEKKFSPTGATLVYLLEESHAAIHTYPEENSLFLDIFTCGHCEPPHQRLQQCHQRI